MKTGIIREVDSLGRLVVPKELRTRLGRKPGTSLEIVAQDDGIFVRRAIYNCIGLRHGNEKELALYNDRHICRDCVKEILRSREGDE